MQTASDTVLYTNLSKQNTSIWGGSVQPHPTHNVGNQVSGENKSKLAAMMNAPSQYVKFQTHMFNNTWIRDLG